VAPTHRPSVPRWLRSEAARSFLGTPSVVVAAGVWTLLVLGAALAGVIAPHDPFDLAALDLAHVRLPPAWLEGGMPLYLLGTDAQGRDMLSALMYGARISLVVGALSVLLSVLIGVSLGLIAGYRGGRTDALIMRLCDVMLSFPAILVALLIAGLGRTLMPEASSAAALVVVVLSIALTGWVQYARTVRGSTLVEREREYVMAARILGGSTPRVLLLHILPNVTGPVLVLATIQLATAILTEATLSFLGVGVPITSPSLGTLIRVGNDYLFSGEWWIALFPGAVLVLIALSVNLLGDWLRDVMNPRLR
jgi:peptide/nickel transport system permease protein